MKINISKILISVIAVFLILSLYPISSTSIQIEKERMNRSCKNRIAYTNLSYLINDKESYCENDTCEVLFIGSSYFGRNDLYELFENLALNDGKQVYADEWCPGGWYLSDHAENDYTEIKINERSWDYVILQGAGINTAYPEYFSDHPVYPALIALSNKILINCNSTKIIFTMPWAFEDGMIWYENWTDTYEDMQIKIFNNTLKYAQDIGLQIAPVGWAWHNVLKENNYPLHYLHAKDWNHPSLEGSYLMACVIFSTVFLENSTGIGYYAGLSEIEGKYFQESASETVFDNFTLWNIAEDLPPSIIMKKPKNFLYIADREIVPLTDNTSIIFGKITIEATAEDHQSGIRQVDLFIDDVLVNTSMDSQFSMLYDQKSFGSYNLKIEANDNAGNYNSLQRNVWIFNL